MTSTPTISTPTVATTSMQMLQMPIVKSAAMSIPVTVYNLAKGKFDRVPYQTERPILRQTLPFSIPTLPSLEHIPNAPTFQVREGTPWPHTVPASKNLFETRADWPIPPLPAPTVKAPTPTMKAERTEVPPCTAAILDAMVMPKQSNRLIEEKCTWEPNCQICKREEEHGNEDWNGDWQRNFHHPQNIQHPKSYDVPDCDSVQIRLKCEWDEKMEHFNKKYGLDYYSSWESESNWEHEHKYETLMNF